MSRNGDESPESFYAEFLEDYFAECDEHLTSIRRNLLALEELAGKGQLDTALLDELFRSFHTLKGISGMVGLTAAEQLAHAMEAYLRLLRHDQAEPTLEGLDALIACTGSLEQVIVARRLDAPIPDISALLSRLSEIAAISDLAREAGAPDQRPETPASIEEQPADDNRTQTWRLEFSPTPELAERGLNVNNIRERLRQFGEIEKASPLVRGEGGIAFEFIVNTVMEAPPFSEWREDGIVSTLIETTDPSNKTETHEHRTPEGALTGTVSGTLTPSNMVRVDLGRLDELMLTVGELVISRARLDNSVKQLREKLPPADWRALQEINFAIERQLRDLREGVMRVRMVPVGEIFERMRFVVRDIARESGKKVALELRGQETEIDKYLVERLTDPLLHIVRNAISHGLEREGERVRAGKSPEGHLVLSAKTMGEAVVIQIEDDGRGMDTGAIAERARARGLIGQGVAIETGQLLEIISTPGFSTRDVADRESGRGVGMDVVKNAVSELGGSISLKTTPGQGTCFRIEVPLTLAIADALIAKVDGQMFAVPQTAVDEVIEIEPGDIRVLENNEIISYRSGVLPLVRLSRLFKLKEDCERACHAFVAGTGSAAVGIVVDKIIGQREIVIRAINDPLVRVKGIAGATEIGDGRVVLILDVPGLIAANTRPGADSHALH